MQTAVKTNWEHISCPQLQKPSPAARLHDRFTSFRLFVNLQKHKHPRQQATQPLDGAGVAYRMCVQL